MPRQPWVQWQFGAWRLALTAALVLALGGVLRAETWRRMEIGPPLDTRPESQGLPGLQLFPRTILPSPLLGLPGSAGRPPAWQAPMALSRLGLDGGIPSPALALQRAVTPDHLSPFLPFQLTSEDLQLTPSLALLHEVSLAATVSLTPNWEVGLIVPTLPVNRVGAVARPLLVHTLGSVAAVPGPLEGSKELGTGDLRFHSQYTVPALGPGGLKLGLFGQVRLPTGSQASELGTRGMGGLAFLTTSWELGRITPYASLGGGILGGSLPPELLYSAGLEVEILPGMSATLDGIGRWTPGGAGLQDYTVDVGLIWRPLRRFAFHTTFEWPLRQAEGLRASNAWTLRINYQF